MGCSGSRSGAHACGFARLPDRHPRTIFPRVLAKYRPVGQLLFAVGGAVLVYLFWQAAIDGRRKEKTTALEILSPAYEGNDRRAPDFELRDKDGKKVRLKSYRGKVVVLNFWTITCGPCREEMPSIEDMARIFEDDDDVVVLTVTADEDWQTVRQLFPDGDPAMPVLFDPERAIINGKYGTRLFPETWIIDGDGIIRARFDGARDWSTGLAVSFIRSLT